MRKQSAKVVGRFFAIVLMVGAHASVARADEEVTAHVPFAFIVGESRLPAGDYIVREMDGDPGVIEIAGADGHQAIFTLTMMSSSSEKRGQPQLVFEKFDAQYFLARVVREDGDEQEIVLTPAIMEREAATARPGRRTTSAPAGASRAWPRPGAPSARTRAAAGSWPSRAPRWSSRSPGAP